MKHLAISFLKLSGLILVFFTGCNNIPDCDAPFTSELVIQFVDSTKTESRPEIFESIREINSGFVFVENDTLRSVVVLEVDPQDTTTGYIFEGVDFIDTLIVSYSFNQMLISELCGPALRVIDLEILSHTFADTVVVSRELLRNEINVQVVR